MYSKADIKRIKKRAKKSDVEQIDGSIYYSKNANAYYLFNEDNPHLMKCIKVPKKITEKRLKEIAREYDLDPVLFTKFMKKRFPNQRDDYYVETWAKRFSSEDPKTHMDLKSRKIYEKLKEVH